MSEYETNELCEVCNVMESVTQVNNKSVCYRCAKKIRKLSRKKIDKRSLEELFDDDDQKAY